MYTSKCYLLLTIPKFKFSGQKHGNIGFRDLITVVEGKNLDLVSRADQRREQGKATDLEALRELAQQRGYKRGWAERVYQARLAKRHGI
jgi:hypothetical protein